VQPNLRCLVQLVHEGCRPSHCEQQITLGQSTLTLYSLPALPRLTRIFLRRDKQKALLGQPASNFSHRRGTKRAPTDRFRHVTHAIDARLRRLSLASWSSLVTNDDRERLRRGEADSERAAAPLMATCRQERERERGGGWTARPLGAIGALLGLRRLSAMRAGADGRG
jgi:hypothetical protein